MPPLELSVEQLRGLRLRAQRLLRPEAPALIPASQVVRAVCAVQAQDPAAAALAVWARGDGLTAVELDNARAGERSLVRTWGPRGTLHLLTADDLGWMLGLLGPVFIAADGARRIELGLDDSICARGIGLMREILAGGGPMPRSSLAERLAERGLPLVGQAFPHLAARAALDGLICLGPEQNGEACYVLVEEWIQPGPALPRPEALAQLTRRYLEAYGPAGPADLARWSGLPMGAARAGWQAAAGDRLEVSCQGETLSLPRSRAGWLAEIDPAAPGACLLPAFDTLLLGYQKRGWLVEPRFASRINAGGGMIRPVALVQGRAAGTWRTRRRRGRLEVLLSPFEPLASGSQLDLEARAQDLGRFVGLPAGLEME